MEPQESEESLWTTPQFTFKGTPSEFNQIIQLLSQSEPKKAISVKYAFESHSMYSKYQQAVEEESNFMKGSEEDFDTNDMHRFREKIKLKKHRAGKAVLALNKKIIDFRQFFELVTFYEYYEKRINYMEKEQNYILIPSVDGGLKELEVYIRDKDEKNLNRFFVSEVLAMNHKLKRIIIRSTEYYEKLKFSKIAQNKLKDSKINVFMLNSYDVCVFYSEFYDNCKEISTAVGKLLNYHSTIFKMYGRYVDMYLMREVCGLLFDFLGPKIKQIEEQYETQVEADRHECSIVINDVHPVFQEPSQFIKQSMNIPKILEIQCNDMSGLKNRLTKLSKKFPILKSKFRYRKCFLLMTDKDSDGKWIKYDKSALDEFYSNISEMLAPKFKIIYHLFQCKFTSEIHRMEMERIVKICEDLKLHIMNFNVALNGKDYFNDFVCSKIIIQSKQSSDVFPELQYPTIQSLFQQLLFGSKKTISPTEQPNVPKLSLKKKFLQDNEQKSEESISKTKIQTKTEDKMIDTKPTEKQVVRSVAQSEAKSAITVEFLEIKSPEFKEEIDQAMEVSKRQRKLQKKINSEFDLSFLIYKILIHSSIKVPQYSAVETYSLIIAKDIFEQNYSANKGELAGFRIKPIAKIQWKKLQELSSGEDGVLCWLRDSDKQYCPLLQVEKL